MTQYLSNIYNATSDYYQHAQGNARDFHGAQSIKDKAFDTFYTAAKLKHDAYKLDLSAGLPNSDSLNNIKPITDLLLDQTFNINFCADKQAMCAFKISKFITYDLPKSSVEAITSYVPWAAKSLFQISADYLTDLGEKHHVIKAFQNGPIFSTVASITESIYNTTINIGSELASKSTELLLGQKPLVVDGQAVPFSAFDLIGPVLFQKYCLNNTKEHLKDGLFYLKLLLTNTREYSTAYAHRTRFGHGEIINNTEYHTFGQLVRYAGMETLFTGLWGALSGASIYKIYDVIFEACGSHEHAFFIATSIAITNLALPILTTSSPLAYIKDPDAALSRINRDENAVLERPRDSKKVSERIKVREENGNVVIEFAQ